eukprot:Phypoly_transcript_20335.p1 GENE.Phypoly_transcript_20335~~Phypoly_transcript_20335.p1  ORF type:complete len:124 (+),score=14.87 Phypoly_transcript_20335:44-373(+)
MKAAWLNEKSSPEILQYESELVSTLLAQIENQQQYFNEAVSNPAEQFQSHLYEMEAERVKYVIRCYLRTRIAKIEKHFLTYYKMKKFLQNYPNKSLCMPKSTVIQSKGT